MKATQLSLGIPFVVVTSEMKYSLAALGSILCVAFAGIPCNAVGQVLIKNDHPHIFEGDVVPNAETASKIAEAIAIPIYGESTIRRELPLTAKLKGDVWIVFGTLHDGWFSRTSGGVVEVEISKRDGRIISIFHSK